MKKIFYTFIFSLFSIAFLSACNSSNANSNPITKERKDMGNMDMEKIEFIPKEFHEVKLGYDENMENVCTPRDESGCLYLLATNEIFINIPQKIICKGDIKPIVPVCGSYILTGRRGLKYAHLSTKMLNIRKVDEETWHSGAITNPDEGHIVYSSYILQKAEERKKKIEEAQKYSEDELDEGNSSGEVINIDLMDYVDIELTSGIYEVFLSFSGLESNHERVEIIIENKADKPDAKSGKVEKPIQPIEPKIDDDLPEI